MKVIDVDEMSTREMLEYLKKCSVEREFPFDCQCIIQELIDRLDNGEDVERDDSEPEEDTVYMDEELTSLISKAVLISGKMDMLRAYIQGMRNVTNQIYLYAESLVDDDEDS